MVMSVVTETERSRVRSPAVPQFPLSGNNLGQVVRTHAFVAESVSEKKLKLVNIWQSYKQERDSLAHFLRLLAVCWPGLQSA